MLLLSFQVLQTATEGLTFVGLKAWASTECPLCAAPSGVIAGCWNVTRQTVFTLLLFSPSPVSALSERVRVLTGHVGSSATRGLTVVSLMHQKMELCIWGGRYVLGEGKRRTTALCTCEVNKWVMFLCSLLLKVSLLHVVMRGIDSELCRGRLPGWSYSWSSLNHRTLMSCQGLIHFHSERTPWSPPCAHPALGAEANVSVVQLQLVSAWAWIAIE